MVPARANERSSPVTQGRSLSPGRGDVSVKVDYSLSGCGSNWTERPWPPAAAPEADAGTWASPESRGSVARQLRWLFRFLPEFFSGAASRTARTWISYFFLQWRQPIASRDAGTPRCGPAPLLRAECRAASAHPGAAAAPFSYYGRSRYSVSRQLG